MTFRHVSAMLHEAVACLACRPGGTYVDGTLGGAGHARAICQQMMPDGRLVGIDQDADAVANARRVLEPYSDNIQLFHGNPIDIVHVLIECIIREFISDIEQNQNARCDAHGKTADIDKSEALVLFNISECDSQIIFQHDVTP